MRGLKYPYHLGSWDVENVALLVSAWIEIVYQNFVVLVIGRRTPRECVD